MEQSTAAEAEFPDLYSVIPYNVTFPDDVTAFVPDGQNQTEQNPAKGTAGIVIAVSITALYSIICVVGLLGNILVMYGVVSGNIYHKSPQNIP
ncbi:hypothetical protein QTP70_021490 [Hemibagrus guttatus]|uniref:Uncharacterized protein n=1 Tax=Hemibagrus guttatus TaxID=175788 RepID=A0AAE0PUJ6_9TELE|nr:hypothetical protein QTP70_021490 [Hemibagrus guttatus]